MTLHLDMLMRKRSRNGQEVSSNDDSNQVNELHRILKEHERRILAIQWEPESWRQYMCHLEEMLRSSLSPSSNFDGR
jgi:hypothetical protein